MNILRNVSDMLSAFSGISSNVIYFTIVSIIIAIIVNLIKIIIINFTHEKIKDAKSKYVYNKTANMISNVIIIILIIMVWEPYFKSIITFLSFLSAGVAISLKDIILNFFAGIYIKIAKPFIIEDRIELNNTKGDVINITNLSFDVLEIDNRIHSEQSTGRIVHIPNSYVFLYPLINYVKGFKYIWVEMKVCFTVDSDIRTAKKLLYEIIEKNVKADIIEKMEDQIEIASANYRIYFNELEPIIYTAINNGHVETYMRFLSHPKKHRNIENDIWCDIIETFKDIENINFSKE
ncbi:MAG: mechanosensitive ion channel [Clostridia bacterium]